MELNSKGETNKYYLQGTCFQMKIHDSFKLRLRYRHTGASDQRLESDVNWGHIVISISRC